MARNKSTRQKAIMVYLFTRLRSHLLLFLVFLTLPHR